MKRKMFKRMFKGIALFFVSFLQVGGVVISNSAMGIISGSFWTRIWNIGIYMALILSIIFQSKIFFFIIGLILSYILIMSFFLAKEHRNFQLRSNKSKKNILNSKKNYKERNIDIGKPKGNSKTKKICEDDRSDAHEESDGEREMITDSFFEAIPGEYVEVELERLLSNYQAGGDEEDLNKVMEIMVAYNTFRRKQGIR